MKINNKPKQYLASALVPALGYLIIFSLISEISKLLGHSWMHVFSFGNLILDNCYSDLIGEYLPQIFFIINYLFILNTGLFPNSNYLLIKDMLCFGLIIFNECICYCLKINLNRKPVLRNLIQYLFHNKSFLPEQLEAQIQTAILALP